MKALSIHPYFACAISEGAKSIECRTWKTDYRGDIVICSTAKKYHGTIPSHALSVVELVDIVPFEKKHLKAALMRPDEYRPGMYAWILRNNRLIVPQPVKGKLSLWNYDGPIEYIPPEEWIVKPGDDPETKKAWYDQYWKPLII